MDKTVEFDYDTYFRKLGVKLLTQFLNSYLETNYPTDEHREFLEKLYDEFPDFRKKSIVYRAIRENRIPKEVRNKYVSGCSTKDDVKAFADKRYDKGYEFIMISNEPVDCFDLYSFINFINKKYGKHLTERYQDEKEIIFKLKKDNDWFRIEKIR